MTPDRLAAALTDRYRLERELGQGGMAGMVTAVVAGAPQGHSLLTPLRVRDRLFI